jgi:hypothetical protein
MARKIIPKKEEVDPMAGVYVIPDPTLYNRKVFPGDPTWEDLYGKSRCVRCGQKMEPGQLYTAKCVRTKHGWRLDVTHYDHCEPPTKKPNKFLRKIQKETPVERPQKGAPGTCDSCGKKGLHHPKDQSGKRDYTKLECRFCHSTSEVKEEI